MFSNFKNLIRKGEKFIMVENGAPAYVVMTYEDYEGMLARRPAEAHSVGNMAERRQEEEFSAKLVMDTPMVPEDLSKIRLEDLPL